MPSTPTPRPAQGFSTLRADKWILCSAGITAVIYGFRMLVEPSTANTTAKGSKVKQLIGMGTPPPLGSWIVAFGSGYFMLAIMALAAPEIAASIAMMMIAGNLLSNGVTIAADIAGLEHTTVSTGTKTPPKAVKHG